MTSSGQMDSANKSFIASMRGRSAEDNAAISARLGALAAAAGVVTEGLGADRVNVALETIVSESRPVLFVDQGAAGTDTLNLTRLPPLLPEARRLVDGLVTNRAAVEGVLPLVGRVNVTGFAGGIDFLGTCWFIEEDIVVTNRHVASLVAQWDGRRFCVTTGAAGRLIQVSAGMGHWSGGATGPVHAVTEILYIERPGGADIAFMKVTRQTDGLVRRRIEIADADATELTPVCVAGYPAEGDPSVIPDQALMRRLYQSEYNVKRLAPGLAMALFEQEASHDCTTLGGNSGSVVLDTGSGQAVGLHYAGVWRERNLAVPARLLRDYRDRRKWERPPEIATVEQGLQPPQPPKPLSARSFNIPIVVTVTVGDVQDLAGLSAVQAPADIETALVAFWKDRPANVIAARVGFLDDGGRIGDTACIAASVRPDRLDAVERPAHFAGFPVRYLAASFEEQAAALPQAEAAIAIAYDDDARVGPEFSFETVIEDMDAILHVGPEYSWSVLKTFLAGAKDRLVSAIYEFHAPHVMKAIEERLAGGVDLRLVMDNLSLTKMKNAEEEFDREATFADWSARFPGKFHAIVAKEGRGGLVARAYHIKVTVRDEDQFWLSSGNWKTGSSQPPISDAQLANALVKDLPGNREWHIVLRSPSLARMLRAHIEQDFRRSEAGGGRLVAEANAADDRFVDIPLVQEEAIVLERRAPRKILPPLSIDGKLRIRPLLTPDRAGAVYSEAVLELIRSASRSLLFQIPYIGMPAKPGEHRGYIDELIEALTRKLKTLPDARVILRTGGTGFSNPAHAAWHFKAQGVDIDTRLRQIDDHHTKGMVIDGARVLIGSHNWSGEGVTINRDASLIIHDDRAAAYFAEAFAIDWDRARPINPKEFSKAKLLEAVGPTPPAGYRRVRLSAVLNGDP